MVYGFVKQSGGHARIQSEVGDGTVVRLYLPRAIVDRGGGERRARRRARNCRRGKETILFVEDDPMVRQHTGQQIVGLGYDDDHRRERRRGARAGRERPRSRPAVH